MISAKEAYEIVKESFPKKHILDCSIYDGKAYLFTVKTKVDAEEYNDPFYLVDARTRSIRQLNHEIDISTLKD